MIRILCSVVVLFAFALSMTAQTAAPIGEPVDGFPNWAERVLLEWMNRARSSPSTELAGCPSGNCAEAGCYSPSAPLQWSLPLNRAARFHADHMAHLGYFSHDSACTLVSAIPSSYPGSCDGSANCACVGGLPSCSGSGCTAWSNRVAMFGGWPTGEIIAGGSDPDQAFYLWMYEPSSTTQCQFTFANGHRWNILTSSGGVGTGVSFRYVGDFGNPATTSGKIPSAAHHPQQASSVELWANWYDSAGPSASSAVVDGVAHPMTLQRGTALNGAFRAVVQNVGSGCHRYYFLFRDAAGAVVRYPANGTFAIGTGGDCPDWIGTRRADFDESKTSDILLRDTATGAVGVWLMSGTAIADSGMIGAAPGVALAGEGDFNGDGHADVLFRDGSGNIGMWLMNGKTILSGALVANSGSYQVIGVDDFNGDGKADILLRDPAGDIGIWLMDGPAIVAGGLAGSPAAYTMAGTGDLNGDGKADIVLRDAAGGVGAWLMNGTAIVGGAFIGQSGASAIAAVADFNGDGKGDILLRDPSGTLGLWLMDGAAIGSGAVIGSATGSQVAGWGDYNGDGKADILLRDAGGNVGIWLMNGSAIVSGGLAGSAGSGYEVR